MSFADALRREHQPQARARCSVLIVAEQLDDADRAALIDAMTDPAISSSSIARALMSIGHSVRQHTINRHRRKDCSCEPL